MKFLLIASLFLAGLLEKTSACRPPDPAYWCFIDDKCDPGKGKICRTHPCLFDGTPPSQCRDYSLCTRDNPLTIQECITGTVNSVVVCNDDTAQMMCDGAMTTVKRFAPTCDFYCEDPGLLRRLQVEACIGGGIGKAGGGGSCSCDEGGSTLFCSTVGNVDGPMVSMWRDPVQVDRDDPKKPAYDPDGKIIIDDTIPGDDKKLTMECDTGIVGEPHIKKWDGTWYDWHGECDAVMVHAPEFAWGEGLDIHVRTKIRYDYSYIQTVAAKIGDEIIEISGFGEYFINGVNDAELPAAITSHAVTHEMIDENDHNYVVDLGSGASLSVHTHKDVVSMVIKTESREGSDFSDWFTNSTGLMGSFHTGESLARDGVTVLADPNAMGEEWQVRDFEPKLFQDPDREPQYPRTCNRPSPDALQTQRRLGQTVSKKAAQEACSIWQTEDAKARCLFDVLKTGDLGIAGSGAY